MNPLAGQVWFGRNAMGGVKPVSWQGWLLSIAFWAVTLSCIFRALAARSDATPVWVMLAASVAFVVVQGETGGVRPFRRR